MGALDEKGWMPAVAYDLSEGYGEGFCYPFVYQSAYVSEFVPR